MAKVELSRVETLHYENLINDNKYPILTAARELNSGAGALKRGTALQVNSDGATLEKMTNGGTASAILAEDAAGGGGVAVVYLTGQFNRQKVDEITGIVRKVRMDSGWEVILKIKIRTKEKRVSLNENMTGVEDMDAYLIRHIDAEKITVKRKPKSQKCRPAAAGEESK